MKLKVLGSSSKGNCYIFENDNEALILECGVRFDKVKQALNFNLSKVVGCLMTHEHGDHAKFQIDFTKAGIDVYASHGTIVAVGADGNHRTKTVVPFKIYEIGSFKVMPFDVKHDAAEPLGFLINHPETGNVLFLTDTYYVPYTFKNLHNIIVEANYSTAIIERKRSTGSLHNFLADRIIKSHMSLETCIELLKSNNLSKVNNIILIHLSDGNSDALHFKNEVEKVTGKNVQVADEGLLIENFEKTPF